MLRTRLIPCLLLKNGVLVRSERFTTHQVVGYPVHEVSRFNEWNVDELLYLDISDADHYDIGRSDHQLENMANTLEILDAVARTCFVPLTFGGRITSVHDMAERFRRGADKVAINSAAVRRPSLIEEASKRFGSQAIVVSIDACANAGGYEVMIDGGRTSTDLHPSQWAAEAERNGAGEILINSIDRDGTGEGYDLELLSSVVNAVSVPVIALGGVGTYEQFAPAIQVSGASAVSAANIFHFKELSDRNAKRALKRAGVPVRL